MGLKFMCLSNFLQRLCLIKLRFLKILFLTSNLGILLLFSITAKFAKPVFCVLLSKIRWPQKKLFLKFCQPRMRSEIFAKPTGYRTMGNIFLGKTFTSKRLIRTNFSKKNVFDIFTFNAIKIIVWSSKPMRFWRINWTTAVIILKLRQKIRKVH